jgi:hypothetical protein
MSRILDGASRRTSVVLVALVSTVLVLLLPSSPLVGAETVGAAVVAIAAAALVHFALRALTLGQHAVIAVPVTRDAEDTPRTDRVTDPTHHPLRPRAPGTA